MIKAGVALMVLLILFSTPLPRETGALIIAALLLANRRITSRTMIATVDWPLLLLVACLFAITGQLNGAGIAARLLAVLSDSGLLPNNLAVLLPFALVTSNAIGSVPAAMLLLQIWPLPPDSVLYSLALLSSLAGNLLLSGSLSTLLVAESAAAMGAPVSFREYARAGVPIAVISLAFASFWLVAIGILPLTPPPVPPPLP
jgi:Na+/H+ antiporter NhaD/arsenite permease-like protein